MIKKIVSILFALMLIPSISTFANTDSKLMIEMEYMVMTPTEDGGTRINEMVSYKNTTDEVFNGDGTTDGIISVLLPPGAKGLTIQDENIKYKMVDTGFVTTEPIPANGSVVIPYFYQIDQGKDIVLTFNYPIQQYQILIPEGLGSVAVKDAQVSSPEMINFDEQKYWGYRIENIQLNQKVTLTYNKDIQPSAAAQEQTNADTSNNIGNVTKAAPDFHNPGHLRMWAQSPLRDFDPHILMIVLGAILVSGIGYFSYFKWKTANVKRAGSDKDEEAFKTLMAKQKAIYDKILELEDHAETGKISEAEYNTKLEAYKQHLAQVKLNLRKFVE